MIACCDLLNFAVPLALIIGFLVGYSQKNQKEVRNGRANRNNKSEAR